MNNFIQKNKTAILWILMGVLSLGLLFTWILLPHLQWLHASIGGLAGIVICYAISLHRHAFFGRSAMFGYHSLIITILVFGVVIALNYLSYKNPKKLDLTAGKIHTLSDQTNKLVSGLQQKVQATLYATRAVEEKNRGILNNYRALSNKFDVEYVNPEEESIRAKQAGITKDGTLLLKYGEKTSKIETVDEEKLTNALIKLVKQKKQTLCYITGHGENDLNSREASGYAAIKKNLEDQFYTVTQINTLEGNDIKPECDAIAIVGPEKAFFKKEIQAFEKYLDEGGRALIALKLNLRGGEDPVKDLKPLLKKWWIYSPSKLVVDPLSRLANLHAAAAVIKDYSRSSPITKNFETRDQSVFPFTRPIKTMKGLPKEIKHDVIAKTSRQSWAENDIKNLSKQEVRFNPGIDEQGPIPAAVAVSGKQKDSKAKRKTRLVVFGTSLFATNNFSRMGVNLDLFINAVAWLLEDESFISIRSKEKKGGVIALSRAAALMTFWICVIIVPLLISITGTAIWVRRRRL